MRLWVAMLLALVFILVAFVACVCVAPNKSMDRRGQLHQEPQEPDEVLPIGPGIRPT